MALIYKYAESDEVVNNIYKDYYRTSRNTLSAVIKTVHESKDRNSLNISLKKNKLSLKFEFGEFKLKVEYYLLRRNKNA